MSVNFNPFDDTYLKLKAAPEIEAPDKIDKNGMQNNKHDIQTIGATEKTNENELVDTTLMADDMDGFFNKRGQE